MLQDVVAPGCGPDGNAVQGFVRSFASQKSEFQLVSGLTMCAVINVLQDAMRAAHQDQHELLPEELEHEGHFHEAHGLPLVHAMDPQMREFMHVCRP